MNSKSITRFLKYTVVGTSTFAVDLLLLYVLIDGFKMNYLVGAGLSFIFAISINYFLSRRFVFKGTQRGVGSGYVNFIAVALAGLLIVIGGMYVLVAVAGVGYVLSRFIIAGLTGFWNYLLNLFVTFKVVGHHEHSAR
jgi:putative flippase GtrA